MCTATTTSRKPQKEQVIRQANRLFAERGIRAVRMDDVATSLTMSKRTLYEMFRDKEELLLECVRFREEEKLAYMRSVSEKAENVLEIIIHFYHHGLAHIGPASSDIIEEIKKYSSVCEYIFLRREENTIKAQGFYRTGVEQGIFRTDINFEIFHTLMGMAMDGFFNSRFLEAWPLTEVFETMLRVNIRGICTEEGARMFDTFMEKVKGNK